MRCAWDALLNILPCRIRPLVDKLGNSNLQELRLRLGQQPELVTANGSVWLQDTVTFADLQFCINTASKYSPWSAHTMQYGYITAPGGHRIGICGEAVIDNDRMTGIRCPNSICIRVAREFPGIASGVPVINKSILVLGPPGSGKTTLLRDIIRKYANSGRGHICVIDERGELFPVIDGFSCYESGRQADIITGCRKAHGIETLLRCMGPSVIAVDEITAEQDCDALIRAGWCGVQLFATAHASSQADLLSRPIYKPIAEARLFDIIITLERNKSWRMERVNK